MSRTDKDKPQWVRDNDQANWKGVEHSDYCLLWGCDLDEPRTATNKCQSCKHRIPYDQDLEMRWYYHVPKDRIRLGYWQPERRRKRDLQQCGPATNKFRADGFVLRAEGTAFSRATSPATRVPRRPSNLRPIHQLRPLWNELMLSLESALAPS